MFETISGLRGWALVAVVILLSACSTGGVKDTSKSSSPNKYSRSSDKYHKVIKGDTLYAVAWKAGVDYRTLARWNNLKSPYTIYPGMVLRLRAPGKSTPTRTSTAKPKSKPKATKPVPAKKPSQPAKPKPTSKSSTALHWTWPTQGRLLSTFKANDPARTGIRIVGKKRQKIYAAESGKVVYVGGGLIGYGQLIIISHNNNYLSAYGHNSRLLVKEGQTVKKGQHIADMGAANSGKAMLHFEIRRKGKPTDPLRLLPRQ
ncbi:MAG: peptidoglycan DD-metalloendopeptidase family protein [bacterium]